MNLNVLSFTFQTPWFFIGLLLLPLLCYLDRRWKNRRPAIRNNLIFMIPEHTSWRLRLFHFGKWFRYLALASMILALARPVKPLQEQEIDADSIEIALIMDLSSSMLAMDFEPNRLEAAKTVARSFVEERNYDLFTLIAFAAESYTVTPLTSDNKLVITQLEGLECGLLEDGTAIGMGLATAVNRLKQGKTKNKVVILLTDGVNNAGYIQPLTAAALAEDLGYKVYTIGVGSMGEALSPVSRRADGQYLFGYVRVEIDEELLQNISSRTGGQYFRATDIESLKQIYDQIDELEKTKIQIRTIMTYKELYSVFIIIALLCIFLDLLFRVFLVKRTY